MLVLLSANARMYAINIEIKVETLVTIVELIKAVSKELEDIMFEKSLHSTLFNICKIGLNTVNIKNTKTNILILLIFFIINQSLYIFLLNLLFLSND